MMGIYKVVIFAFILGFCQAEKDCRAPAIDEQCGRRFETFPGNEEQFNSFCNDAIPFLECSLAKKIECGTESSEITLIQNAQRLLLKMCNEDTLLNKAIKENIACIESNFQDLVVCSAVDRLTGESPMQDYEEFLSEIKTGLTDEDIDSNCPRVLYETSCTAARGGQLCGEATKGIVIEVVEGMGVLSRSCSPTGEQQFTAAVDNRERKLSKANEVDITK